MARRKVRLYSTVKQVEELIDNYFEEHREEVTKDLLKKAGEEAGREFKTVDELKEFDFRGSYYGGFPLSCGFVWVKPRSSKQAHEWFLDNDRIPDYASPRNYVYNTQCTVIKEIQMRKAFDDLGLDSEYSIYVRLD